MRFGIIGGGLAGLACAYELARSGHQVLVFEKETHLGGQVATFEVEGSPLERIYHHIFRSDAEMLRLIGELGLAEKLRWLPSRVGYYTGGRICNFTTPLDLMRFSPLGLVDRLRLGLLSLYLQRVKGWQKFEAITAREWLLRYGGRRNYEAFWEPLLKGKFGQSASEISMAWLWGRMRVRLGSRGRGLRQEYLGYLEGSFGRLVDALAQGIKERGGQIYPGSPVRRIGVKGGRAVAVELASGQTFPVDGVIATVASPLFLNMVELPPDTVELLKQARYLAARLLVLTMEQPFQPVYWLNIGDPAIPFVAAVEHTNLVNPSLYGGRRVLYISNYLPRESPLYHMEPGELLSYYLPYLKKINPEFDTRWVREYHVFQEDWAQPIVGVDYSRQIPPHPMPIGGLYLANTTQIYPEDRGMNQAICLGLKIAQLVKESR